LAGANALLRSFTSPVTKNDGIVISNASTLNSNSFAPMDLDFQIGKSVDTDDCIPHSS
jgi:hypothetical protein